jgi:hypothetical protein
MRSALIFLEILAVLALLRAASAASDVIVTLPKDAASFAEFETRLLSVSDPKSPEYLSFLSVQVPRCCAAAAPPNQCAALGHR